MKLAFPISIGYLNGIENSEKDGLETMLSFVLNVSVDGLDLGVGTQSVDTVFSAVTRVLVASEGHVYLKKSHFSKVMPTFPHLSIIVSVDEHGAGLQQIGDSVGSCQIPGKHSGREPIHSVIRSLHYFVLAVERQDQHHSAENLLAHRFCAVLKNSEFIWFSRGISYVQANDDSGLEIESVFNALGVNSVASTQQSASLLKFDRSSRWSLFSLGVKFYLLSTFYIRHDSIQMELVNIRSDSRVLVQRVANFQLFIRLLKCTLIWNSFKEIP